MAATIAPEPIALGTAVAQHWAHSEAQPAVAGEPLPPFPPAGPEPMPAPAMVPPTQAFAAALIAERMPARPPSLAELRLRMPSGWQPPASSLRLTDRRV